ncbi:hypothetical protein [Hydrogenophaga sp.]|uniref:hypothetical protein n=1 Tax=Hydrogenophaga sp. TaxID=1904254 RepID=UPI00272F26AE|nr:hypothetical protein [Hydrogenophaga sp.]MDP1684982.1 hypothetical protein [Hydrogenophaga sp.]
MTDDKKGLVASDDQALNSHTEHTPKFIRTALFLIAYPETSTVIEVAGFTVGPMLARLWGGA